IGWSAWGWGRCFCLATTNVPVHAGLFKPYLFDFPGKFLGISQGWNNIFDSHRDNNCSLCCYSL
ncbi:hypothetical protein, partial [Azotobacter chroococcum]|uniref:hypothetical protein n=1 Tax=Azotobacter chroococcum TaxID=353 RepID=UPI001939A40D